MPEETIHKGVLPMSWLEVSLSVDAEVAEAVADVLARVAPHGVVLETERVDPESPSAGPTPPTVVRAYLPQDSELAQRRRRMEEGLWHLGQIRPLPAPVFREVEDTDWEELWKVSYGPTMIGERLQIVPAWLTAPPGDRKTVWIDPGMAFGTGTHPTTRMCLEVLEKILLPGQVVADLGCGSGILSFAAAQLGAVQVFACDTDTLAVAASLEGAERNGVAETVEVFEGSLDALKSRLLASGQSADLLMGNLLAPILIDLLSQGLGTVVRPGGRMVLSGILAEQAAEVLEAAGARGLQLVETRAEADWRALVLQVT
jgi:ribosomal protein L11 methyltransferase